MTVNAMCNVRLWTPALASEQRPNGEILVWREDSLSPYPDKINERLVHWATTTPERVWMADRQGRGAWRKVTYAHALDSVRRIGQFLLNRGLSVERPLLILSENSIEHALMALGAQHVGVASAAIAPAYATSNDLGKLNHIRDQITPGLVFAEDAVPCSRALAEIFDDGTPFVAVGDLPAGRTNCFRFADVLKTEPTDAVDRAFAAVGPDTVAKFLFTSGTTGSPKAVIQTQRMLCSNQEMVADCYAFFRDEPPIVVDWAPWNHTASGNKVFNLVIYNGGTYYIDRGKPTAALIGQTLDNIRDVSPTWYFNVPVGYEMLIQAMREDEELRRSFFREIKVLMYAGAGMAQHTCEALLAMCESTLGHQVPLGTGFGSTETAPFATYCTDQQDRPGNIGIPAQGVTLKLVPIENKYELRLKGPNVTPGYWRNAKLTVEAFDDEGFYRIGDTVKLVVPGDPRAGFYFGGRITENFKLQTGTWVGVGQLRAQLVNQFVGLIRDAVITGENRAELGALLLPFMPALRELVPGSHNLSDAEIMDHPNVRAKIAVKVAEHQRQTTGSSTSVMRVLIMREPLRFEKGEVTDKGSVNQRAVLANRKDLVEELYADTNAVITADKEAAA